MLGGGPEIAFVEIDAFQGDMGSGDLVPVVELHGDVQAFLKVTARLVRAVQSAQNVSRIVQGAGGAAAEVAPNFSTVLGRRRGAFFLPPFPTLTTVSRPKRVNWARKKRSP